MKWMVLAAASVAVGLMIAAVGGVAYAQTPAEQSATTAAEQLLSDTYSAMTSETGDAERQAALRDTISASFAFDVWEKFLLGDAAASFSPEETDEFRQLLPSYLARLYSNNFGKGLSEEPIIGEARTVRRDVVVSAKIPRDAGAPLPVEYRFRDFAERGPLVIDVMVAGASFLILKRDEFGALMQREGPASLLTFMRDFAAAPRA